MSNWSFTGRPDVPAWPKDETGREEQAVLLTQTFDAPADADTVISLLSAYGIPCFKYYDKDYANAVLELQAAVRLQGAGTESYRGSCYCTCQ